MDGEKSGDKVGKASLPTKGKGEKGLQSSIKNVNREKSKERSAHSSSHSEAVKSKEKALDCGDRNETGTRSWTSKSKVVSLSTKQTGSCGLSSACLQPGVSALQRKNINRMGKSCNQRNVPSHCNENTDGGDSSGRGEREVFSTDDITAHLRRLTEEHGKLQSEYARVRILLQDACIRLKHNDANAGVAVESTEGAKTGSDSSINQMEDSVSPLESDKGTFEGNDDDRGESTEVIKEHFRKEVLRLKESLLTSQQQVSSLTQSLTACKQEVIQERAINDELKQEISARGVLVEQLHKQVDQLKHENCEINSELNTRVVELYSKLSDMSQTLKATEKELKETKEFMQDENNSLTEALREMEDKASCTSLEVERLNYLLQAKEKHCHSLSQLTEQLESQLQFLHTKLTSTQDSAKHMLLTQGAEMSSCSVAIRGLYVIVEEIIQRILNSAEVLGVNLCPILNEQLKCRRSLEGRRLVHAILEAAKEDEIMDNPNPDLILAENGAQPVFSNGSVSPMVENQSAVENNSSTVGLTVLVKDLESNLRKVGRMQETVNHFLAMLLNDSDTAKAKLEQDLCEQKKKVEEVVVVLEECRKERWLCEERNKDLTLKLADTKAGLRDARESLQTMWNGIDERASWLIENQKMTEQIVTLKKQCSELSAKNNFLESELKEILSHIKDRKHQGIVTNDDDNGSLIEKQLALKRQVMDLQALLMDKDEELQEKSKKYERHNSIMEGNLHKAEQEVQKLDAIIDGVLEAVRGAEDLHVHPVLKRLWEDLDGQSYVDNPT